MRHIHYIAAASLWLVTGAVAFGQSQPTPGELDMTGSAGSPPKEYLVLPVPRGDLKLSQAQGIKDATVKTPDGKKLGTLDRLIMDTKTGQVEYGVIALQDTNRLVPVQWSSFQVNRKKGEVVLNVTKDQLEPLVDASDMKDLSPDIRDLVKQMENVRAESPQKGGTRKGPSH